MSKNSPRKNLSARNLKAAIDRRSTTSSSRLKQAAFTSFVDRERYRSVEFKQITEKVSFGGIGTNEAGHHFYLLRVGARRKPRYLTVAFSDIELNAREFFGRLAKAGAPHFNAKSKRVVLEALQAHSEKRPSFAVATKPGWTRDLKAFVHPAGLVGVTEGGIEFGPSEKRSPLYDKFCVRSNAVRWKERVGALHHGNSLGITLAAAALASPLLNLMGEASFALCVVGPGGTGKSSWLVAASSQWGAHRNEQKAKLLGAAESANHTINSLEDLFAAHNDVGLVIDDFRTLRGAATPAQIIDNLAFMLSEGEQRGRLNSLDAPERYRALLLTSANESLQAMAARSRYRVDRALLDRFIEIPLPSDITAVDDLHRFATLADFCSKLRDDAVRSSGGVGHLFLKKLIFWLSKNRAERLELLRRCQRAFEARYEGAGAKPRVLRRFGFVYAAGRLAIKFGLHSWTRIELRNALAESLRGHVRLTETFAPGGEQASEVEREKILAHLRDWYVRTRPTMRDLTKHPITSAAPDKKDEPAYLYRHELHGEEILLKRGAFEKMLASVCDPRMAKQILSDAGILHRDSERASVKRTAGRDETGMALRMQVIALSHRALDPSSKGAD